MKKEIWKDIENFEGLYQISNKARVRSLDRSVEGSDGVIYNYKGKILKQGFVGEYPAVYLSKNGKKKTIRVHRLIARHFLPPIKGKAFVNHKDLDRTNNSIDNLEWCTHQENIKHAHKNGVYSPKGESGSKTTLKRSDVLEIRKRLESGETGTSIAKYFNITKQAVSSIKLRRTWKHI